MDDAVAWPGDGSHCSCLLSGWADAARCPIRRRRRRRRLRSSGTEHQGELKAASWRAAAAAEAQRLATPAGRDPPSARVAHRRRRAAAGAAHRPHHARGPRAPRARLRRRAQRGRPADRRPRLRARHRARHRRLARRAADARAQPAAPGFLVLRRNTQFWTHAGDARGSQRTPSAATRRCSSTTPAAGCSSSRWRAGARRTGWRGSACARARGAPPRRLPGRRAAPDRRRPARARAPARGGFLAWEHYFSWGGGSPPWISGMTQATAIRRSRAARRALDEPRWRRAAHRALGAFDAPPPVGVRTAATTSSCTRSRPACGSSTASCRRSAGSASWPRSRATATRRRLFARGERTTRAMVAAADTGAWSLYSWAGRESTLGYHQLIEEFLGDMCLRTQRRTYCAAREAVRPLRARADAHRHRAAAAPEGPPHDAVALLDLEGVGRDRARVEQEGLSLTPHLSSRTATTRSMDPAGARPLPPADRRAGPERPARRRDPQAPRRPAQAEAEEACKAKHARAPMRAKTVDAASRTREG